MTRSLFKTPTITLLFSMLTLYCNAQVKTLNTMKNSKESLCKDDCMAKNKTQEMACKLTSPELQKRKETVIAGLKRQILEKKELKNGYAFKFSGTDEVLDELTEFIKTERQCCDFFIFTISVSGDEGEAWLELTGASGVKNFIATELGL